MKAAETYPPGERVKAFGRFGVYTPYESHDGEVGWTVQTFETGDDVGDMGFIVAEFHDQADAELFARLKADADVA
jgi:hypothetical protein